MPAPRIASSSASRSVCSAMSTPVSLQDRIPQRHPPPRRREVDRLAVALDLERPDRFAGHRRDQLLGHRRHVQVVAVGLVGLEHRELGVVLVGDALVAEVLAELVDLLETAHDQPLQIELGRDPQVQGAVEHVVVGREGTRQRAAVQRLQHGGLDLEEPALVEEAPDRAHHPGAQDEQRAGLLVRDQVQLAVTVALLDIGQPVVLVRRRAQRLGEHRPPVDAQRQLSAPGPERERPRRRSGRPGRGPRAARSRRPARPCARGAGSARSGR